MVMRGWGVAFFCNFYPPTSALLLRQGVTAYLRCTQPGLFMNRCVIQTRVSRVVVVAAVVFGARLKLSVSELSERCSERDSLCDSALNHLALKSLHHLDVQPSEINMCAGKDAENELLEILNKVLTCRQTRSHRRDQPVRMHRRATPHLTPRNYLRSVIDGKKKNYTWLDRTFCEKTTAPRFKNDATTSKLQLHFVLKQSIF